jgi:hypothetical protein
MTRAIRHALVWIVEVLVLRPLTCIVPRRRHGRFSNHRNRASARSSCTYTRITAHLICEPRYISRSSLGRPFAGLRPFLVRPVLLRRRA